MTSPNSGMQRISTNFTIVCHPSTGDDTVFVNLGVIRITHLTSYYTQIYIASVYISGFILPNFTLPI